MTRPRMHPTPLKNSASRRVHRLVTTLLIVASAASLRAAQAQEPARPDERGVYASRATLEARATAAEHSAADQTTSSTLREASRGEAWRLRYRLSEGDFLVGDRIVITVAGEPTLSDTFTVRAGPTLLMGELPAMSLRGILRSELTPHVTSELARYLRQPSVTAIPLLRVAVMGQVGQPGFYHVPADVLLSDVLMLAGGPAGDADLKRSLIRRGETPLYAPASFSVALADGISLDMLGLQSGDVVVLEERRRRNWGSVFQIVGVVSSVLAIVVGLGS